jgi:UDP-N-acetylmuramate dehydrogenase
MNLSGLEALSLIPGTVGGTPVQNVGAYGSEVKDTIVEVEVFDIQNKIIKILSNSDCKFKYRDSIFKNEDKGKYIIITVTYRLLKNFVKIPDYPGVKRYLIENNINNPHLKEIREAIIYIRNEKLPNPKELPNVGSFFKNPIVSKEFAMRMKNQYEGLTTFPTDDGGVKIPAGWLIENAGLKGKSFGNISVYDKNALILINNGEATKEDLSTAKNEIIKIVKDKFGIELEQEPEMI